MKIPENTPAKENFAEVKILISHPEVIMFFLRVC